MDQVLEFAQAVLLGYLAWKAWRAKPVAPVVPPPLPDLREVIRTALVERAADRLLHPSGRERLRERLAQHGAHRAEKKEPSAT